MVNSGGRTWAFIATLGVVATVSILDMFSAAPLWAGERIIAVDNINLQINAYGGAAHGTKLKIVSNCPARNTDCTWTILSNGMIVSDTNPSLAWNAYGGARHGAEVTLVNNCQPSNPDCTWTVRSDGLIVSNANHKLAVTAVGGAQDGAPLQLVYNCRSTASGCQWLSMTPRWPRTFAPLTMSVYNNSRATYKLNAYGGASHGTELRVVNNCPTGNSDCHWRMRDDGMILSDTHVALAWKVNGGALVGNKVILVDNCSSNDTDCQWVYFPTGLIVSRTNPALAVKATGGPSHKSPVVLVPISDCLPAPAFVEGGCYWDFVGLIN